MSALLRLRRRHRHVTCVTGQCTSRDADLFASLASCPRCGGRLVGRS